MDRELALMTEVIVVPFDRQPAFMDELAALVWRFDGTLIGGEVVAPWQP